MQTLTSTFSSVSLQLIQGTEYPREDNKMIQAPASILNLGMLNRVNRQNQSFSPIRLHIFTKLRIFGCSGVI